MSSLMEFRKANLDVVHGAVSKAPWLPRLSPVFRAVPNGHVLAPLSNCPDLDHVDGDEGMGTWTSSNINWQCLKCGERASSNRFRRAFLTKCGETALRLQAPFARDHTMLLPSGLALFMNGISSHPSHKLATKNCIFFCKLCSAISAKQL